VDSGHAHAPGHAHAHGAGGHGAPDRTRLGWAALLTAGFMAVEIAGGVVSGSLALLADAGHMFTDVASLALAWFAAGLAERPADWKRTYGFDRFAVLVAFVNGLALFVIAAFIVYEAVTRLFEPVAVAGPLMLGVAAAGLAVNVVAFLVLHGADRENLNVRGAALHVMGDLLGSAAAILAALVIILTGWTPADPILSVLVALIILRSGWHVVRDAGHILLEGAPAGIDTRKVSADLVASVEGLADVHHVHAWSISQERKMMTLHARIDDDTPPEQVIRAVKQRLRDTLGVRHVTVEIERGPCADEAPGKTTP
jgi:cobalt-zinc-cadmium efflux system protein